jgi:hypothetical protein
MSNIFINVLDVAYVHDTAKYFPFVENLSLKDPNASVSNFQILRSGNSHGKSTNFSHLLSNYFFSSESASYSISFLPEGLVSPPTIVAYESRPTSLSQGALEI